MSRVLEKPELLAPAGNMEKGKMALLYGAESLATIWLVMAVCLRVRTLVMITLEVLIRAQRPITTSCGCRRAVSASAI